MEQACCEAVRHSVVPLPLTTRLQRRARSPRRFILPSARGRSVNPAPPPFPRVLLGVGVPGGRRQPAAARPCGGERGSGAGGGEAAAARPCAERRFVRSRVSSSVCSDEVLLEELETEGERQLKSLLQQQLDTSASIER